MYERLLCTKEKSSSFIEKVTMVYSYSLSQKCNLYNFCSTLVRRVFMFILFWRPKAPLICLYRGIWCHVRSGIWYHKEWHPASCCYSNKAQVTMGPMPHLQPCVDISDTFTHLRRHYTVMYGQLHWALAFLYL